MFVWFFFKMALNQVKKIRLGFDSLAINISSMLCPPLALLALTCTKGTAECVLCQSSYSCFRMCQRFCAEHLWELCCCFWLSACVETLHVDAEILMDHQGLNILMLQVNVAKLLNQMMVLNF